MPQPCRAGSALSLGSLQIEFHFLGAPDSNACQASGAFQIDSFLRQGNGALDQGLLGDPQFTAYLKVKQNATFAATNGQ